MGIEFIWDNREKTIARHVYRGKWTLEDYYLLIDTNYAELSQFNHTVHIINDLRESGPLPSGLAPAIRFAARKAPLNEGLKLMVGASTFVKSLIDLVNQTAGDATTNILYVATLEEAYALIGQHPR